MCKLALTQGLTCLSRAQSPGVRAVSAPHGKFSEAFDTALHCICAELLICRLPISICHGLPGLDRNLPPLTQSHSLCVCASGALNVCIQFHICTPPPHQRNPNLTNATSPTQHQPNVITHGHAGAPRPHGSKQHPPAQGRRPPLRPPPPTCPPRLNTGHQAPHNCGGRAFT